MSIQPHQDDEQHDETTQQPKQKRAPFAQLPHYVLTNRNLSPGDRELYAHLDTFWRSDNDECWPSQETLAARMGVKNVCTVYRRAKKLEAAKLIEIKRQGLNKPNRYKRLPPPRPDLRLVPDLDAEDIAGVQAPDLASVQGLDLAAMQGEADAVEADALEADKSKSTARTAPLDAVSVSRDSPSEQSLKDQERLAVVRYMEAELLPVVENLHAAKGLPFNEKTRVTLARLLLREDHIHEGHIAHVTDKFTGDVPDGRYSVFDVDAIEDPAAYAYGTLERYGDYDEGELPMIYEASRASSSRRSGSSQSKP